MSEENSDNGHHPSGEVGHGYLDILTKVIKACCREVERWERMYQEWDGESSIPG